MNSLKLLRDARGLVGEKNGVFFTEIVLTNDIVVSKRSKRRNYDFEAKDLNRTELISLRTIR